ncbi:DUF6537 domain-containing protein [Streptomyces iranensis]|uniref:DUF6537 domain-containing protein n=1 Tax=Streptomyces iranensis TaxID=576784 RepID=UPI0039B7346D
MLDLFGYAEVRRQERALIEEYPRLVRAALARLTPGNAAAVEDLVRLVEAVRGYEDIKLARVEEFRTTARAALDELTATADAPAAVSV